MQAITCDTRKGIQNVSSLIKSFHFN